MKMEWVYLGKSFDYGHFKLGHWLREIKEVKYSKCKEMIAMVTNNWKSSDCKSGY